MDKRTFWKDKLATPDPQDVVDSHESDSADAVGRGEKAGNIRNPGRDGRAGTSDDVRVWDLDNDGFDSPNNIPASAVKDAGNPGPGGGALGNRETRAAVAADKFDDSKKAAADEANAPHKSRHRRKVRNQPGDKFTGQFHYEYD